MILDFMITDRFLYPSLFSHKKCGSKEYEYLFRNYDYIGLFIFLLMRNKQLFFHLLLIN